MGLASQILDFRLNIDTEYQGWILMFATLTAVWIYCMPCYCAGMQMQCCRRLAQFIQMRLPHYLFVATCANLVMIYLVIKWLPDWEISDYVKCGLRLALFMAKNAVKFTTSIAMIAVFIFVVAFKDRILRLMGIDHKTIFRFKLRDIFNMGGTSTRAIELVIWKVEDLPAAQMFSPNNVFVEVNLGYNEPMKTRVHNNAGSNCIMKETIQLNFDENEDEEFLYLFVKNQKVMGAGELARAELKPDLLFALEQKYKNMPVEFREDCFEQQKLMPRGTIWLRVREIDDEEDNSMRC